MSTQPVIDVMSKVSELLADAGLVITKLPSESCLVVKTIDGSSIYRLGDTIPAWIIDDQYMTKVEG